MADFASIQNLSNAELFAQLKERGVTTPVTGELLSYIFHVE